MLNKKPTKNILVFTDLDGTLLDHDSYSFKPASHMLDFLKHNNIPLIIVTSKTKSEVLQLQEALGITAPFIIENGAGIYLPKEEGHLIIPLGKRYDQTRRAFVKYAEEIPMYGFSDMQIDEIAERTSLSPDRAYLASRRDFSEPFVLDKDEDLQKLRKMAEKDGFDVVKGGRFYHLITKGQDKAAAIRKVIQHYENLYGTSVTSIALGDSENDLTMLQSVDVPILIPHPDGSYIPCDIPHLIKAPFPGPEGWNSALKGYLHVQ
ncbi:HAD-IIB family hydrolase [Sulfurimonas sp. HSL3-7]|uniref:HAD-IIB family hydrolase n=1 Tax=Sulfonitrofixus jiaomeiensis TaxID=3131938 RepID=UPI0031F9D509